MIHPESNSSPNVQRQLRSMRRLVAWALSVTGLLMLALLAFLPVDERIIASGRVRAARDTRIFAPTDGILKSVDAWEGETVTKGQPVLRLDDTEHVAALKQIEAGLAKARSELETGKARLERTKKLPLPKEFWHLQEELGVAGERIRQSEVEYERAIGLQKRGLISLQEAERARLAVEIARADEMKVREKLDILRKGLESSIVDEADAELQTARAAVHALEIERKLRIEDIERCILRASEAGTVTLLNKRRPGERVQRGEDLAHLAHGSATRVDIFAGENQFYRVKPGQDVLMKSNAFDTLRHGYIRGHVVRVSIEPESEVTEPPQSAPAYRVVVCVDQSPQELTIGSTVEARIILQRIPLWKLLLPETLR